MDEAALREEILATARRLNAAGINRGAAGNISARWRGGFLVTPTGMDYDRCTPSDMVFMGMDGTWSGSRKPSSEWRIHRDIYGRRDEAGAIVHCHSPFATALACLRRAIPPVHYMIARFGGADVRCADYATFGTQALSDQVLKALEQRCACLLANHGMLVFGRGPRHAFDLAVELETLCEQYGRALEIGEPIALSDDEIARVVEKFRTYGQQD